jgi:hypothetical protein
MGLRSSLRAHPVAVALLSAFLLLVGAAAAVFYVGGDERRAARILSAFLSERLGHPVEIARATTDGTSYLILSRVRVPPAGEWTTDLAIREIRVDGPLPRALLGPEGQHFRIQVLSTSVTLAQAAEPPAPPTVAALEQLRGLMTRLLEWRATASFGLSGGELRARGRVTHFDATGEKSADGKVALRLTARSGTGAALIIDGAGSIVDRVVTMRLSAEGDPRALGGIWPDAVPARGLSGVAVFSLPRATHLDVDGQATLTPDTARPPLSLSIRAAYLAGESRADLSKLAVEWGPALRLSGSGSASELNASPRVGLKLEGSIAGSPLNASFDLSAGDRRLALEAHLREARLRPFLEQAGLGDQGPPRLDGQVASARVASELLWAADGGITSGRARGRLERVVVEGGGLGLSAPAADVVTTLTPDGADGLRADSSITAPALDARLGGQTHRVAARSEIRHLLPRSAPWHELGFPERVALALSSPDGAAILQATATPASRDRSSGRQFSIQASLPDLSRLSQFVQGMRYEATGSARLDGALAWSPEGAPRFRGEADVRIPRLAFPRFAAVVSDLAGKIPVWHGLEGSAPLGTVTIQSLTSSGVGVSRFSSPAQIQDGVLNLPAATYVHYGGGGKGWAQADLTDPNLPVRFRFEGAQVDLGRFFAETGLQAARVTGQARYVVGLIFSRQFGSEAAGEFHVDPPGGVISIDVLKRLILSAPESPLGIVRETLEELSEFRYKALDGQLYMDGQETHVSLSLQGKERLGIFPPKIRAINIQNLPLSRAMKLLGPHLRRESS